MNGGFLGELQLKIPVKTVKYDLRGKKPMLVIVDEVRGFCEVGKGNLAPPVPDFEIARMVFLTHELAIKFLPNKLPVLVFADTHEPGVLEPPYPPHCERGTGEEELVPLLRWLEKSDLYLVKIIRKDCINGFVGGMSLGGRNEVLDWVNRHSVDVLVVAGICTDICVLDFVCTMLSVRNCRIKEVYGGDDKIIPSVKDIVVYTPACATYDLQREVAVKLGLPPEASHPRDIMQHTGLKIMADRGAILAHELVF